MIFFQSFNVPRTNILLQSAIHSLQDKITVLTKILLYKTAWSRLVKG